MPAVRLGSGWFTGWLFAHGGVLNVPTALGVPAGLPGLRLWLSGTRRRRPDAGRLRLFGSGWFATILAAMAANVVRMLVTSFVSGASVNVYLGVAGAALGFGLLWGLACGWLIGLAAMLARRFAMTRT